MAVEARHSTNTLFHSCNHIVLANGDFMKINQVTGNTTNHIHMVSNNDETMLVPVYNQSQNIHEAMNIKQSGSDLTYNPINLTPRKRQRDHSSYPQTTQNKIPSLNLSYSPFNSDIAIQIQQNQFDEIDRFVTQHTKEVGMELEKQKRREARVVVRALEEGIARRLKEKDEEIVRMGKLNWVLQERVKSLCAENQLWRDIAQSNEATAVSLRSNLHRVLLSAAEADEKDAESCCGENDKDEEGVVRMCRGCGEEEARVLLLPCRHLCLCAPCGSHLRACPVCFSLMTASVRVNFS